jgi:hypothetical protein
MESADDSTGLSKVTPDACGWATHRKEAQRRESGRSTGTETVCLLRSWNLILSVFAEAIALRKSSLMTAAAR